MAKKVLIISYYWPPSGGAGVQRWLKFVKYMRDFGWEPVIYTPENPEAPAIDNSLGKDIPDNLTVIKRKIWEPYSAYKKFIGQKKEQKINAGFLSENKKPKLSENISVWIRGNLFIPDARKFWIKPSIKFLINYLKKNPVDAIISTGPPHSMHLIANGLKNNLGLPWIADFRDPWTNIDFYKDLRLGRGADKKHHQLELQILKNADRVIVISNGMKKDFQQIFNRDYHVITNGFDEDDLPDTEVSPDKKFSIAHIGSITKSRNPEILWKILNKLVKENPEFKNDLKINFVGKVDFFILESIRKNNLSKFLTKTEYLPHDEVIKIQIQSQVLLLLINRTTNAKMILTGKLFEYMSAGRPILCIGPVDGDAAEIIRETGCGVVSNFDDEKLLQNNVLQLYQEFQTGKQFLKTHGIEKYSRKSLTAELVKILNGVF